MDNIQSAEIRGFIFTCLQALNGRMSEPTQPAETIVHRHQNNVFSGDQLAVIVIIFETRGIAAAMNPNHHWVLFSSKIHWRANIQEKAIF